MGFSLKMFFEELEGLINHEHLEEMARKDVIRLLKDIVDSNKKYAKECGQL